MNLKEIIEATLIELDRGTEADTVAMYAPKFTMYANEAVNEITRRFKLVRVDPAVTQGPGPDGLPWFDASDLERAVKRLVHVYKGAYGTPTTPGDDPPIVIEEGSFNKPLWFNQSILGMPYICVRGKDIEPGTPVWVEYRYVPEPMSVTSLTPTGTPPVATPDEPELPAYLHELIPLYVRAREQCGQDPSTQGTSSAFFSLFNQKVYQLQRETMATPDSFKLIGYHFE